MTALDYRLLGRLGGAGLLAGAFLVFALLGLPRWGSAAGIASVLLAIVVAVLGALALRARWSGQPAGAGLALAAVAYVTIGLASLAGGVQAVYGPLGVVVAAWSGLMVGPRRARPLAPLALLCYGLPAALGRTALDGAGVLGTVLVAAVTGEVLGRLAHQVRGTAARERRRQRALQALAAGQLDLARAANARTAAALAVRLAFDLVEPVSVALLVLRDGRRVPLACWPRPATDGVPGVDRPTATEIPFVGRPGSGVRGVLAVQAQDGRQLGSFALGLLHSVAAMVAVTLENVTLAERLRTRAEIDPLTGLGNRRRLDAALNRIAPGDLVVVLDLDRFKAVNDTLGHEAGDRVLRNLGALLTSQTRAGELAVRSGGEEFVLIVAGGRSGGVTSAARLLTRLAEAWWARRPKTTFSAGAAVHDGGDPAATVARADRALYEAKRRGRATGWILDAGQLPPQGMSLTFPGQPFAPSGDPAAARLIDLSTA